MKRIFVADQIYNLNYWAYLVYLFIIYLKNYFLEVYV